MSLPAGSGRVFEELCSFLDRTVPDAPFPHENRGTEAPEVTPVSGAPEGSPSSRYATSYHRAMASAARRSAAEVVPYVMDLVDPGAVIDVGCGLGSWLAAFSEHGVDEILGIDRHERGSEALEIPLDRYRSHDLTRPLRLDETFDLALCLEVAEHLPESSADRLVEDLVSLAPATLFSAAVPGQRGQGHVNERWPDYWVQLFAKRDRMVVDVLRPRIWTDDRVEWWYRQNLLLFVSRAEIRENSRLQEARRGTREQQLSVVHPELYERIVDERTEYAGELWGRRASRVREVVEIHVDPGATYLFLDDGRLGPGPETERDAVPFPEKGGVFAGPPADGETAVRELERQRRDGAEFMVVAWPAFWWLDHYQELREHLRAEARRLHEGDDAVVFDLRPPGR